MCEFFIIFDSEYDFYFVLTLNKRRFTFLVNGNCLHFTYDENSSLGPSNWAEADPSCNGDSQSPINIDWSQVVFNSSARPLQINGASRMPEEIQAENSHKGTTFYLKFDNGLYPNITGGPLGKNVYVFHSFHVHYGGSEHTISFTKYDAELHIVHYNFIYEHFQAAKNYPDGLAVLGFFYSLAPKTNIGNQLPYSNALPYVQEFGSKYIDRLSVFSYRDLIKQKNVNVATYQGSLTVPHCEESVTWLVAPNPLLISQRELAQLRTMKNCEGNSIQSNSRPTQKANGRKPTVYAANLGPTGWFNPRLLHG